MSDGEDVRPSHCKGIAKGSDLRRDGEPWRGGDRTTRYHSLSKDAEKFASSLVEISEATCHSQGYREGVISQIEGKLPEELEEDRLEQKYTTYPAHPSPIPQRLEGE